MKDLIDLILKTTLLIKSGAVLVKDSE